MQETIFISGWVIFAVWSVVLVPSVVMLLVRRLERQTRELPDLDPLPTLSVIVPARDEGAKIEAALQSLLSSDYPNLKVIAVDDRSTDHTGEVMDRLAATDSRMRVIHISQLPENWLGKTFAMHVASQAADGEYLLFTDGDVVYEPETIRLTMRYVERRNVDHLCLMPKMLPGGYWENALIAYFGLIFAVGTFAWLVPTRFKRAYVGVGAFNLVRRSVYDQVGGHLPIQLDVLDDVKLGKLIKRHGFRQDVMLSENLLRVRWQDSAKGVIRGLEKNAFASLDYSITKLLLVTLAFLLLMIGPYVAVGFFPDIRSAGHLATIVLLHTMYAFLAITFGGGWTVLPVLPVAGVALLYAFWRSAVITLRQGGVRWRETFYPLKLLREHLFR